MDLKIYSDKCTDADYEVVDVVPATEYNGGLIYAPYIPITLTKPMDDYTAFMLSYNYIHAAQVVDVIIQYKLWLHMS